MTPGARADYSTPPRTPGPRRRAGNEPQRPRLRGTGRRHRPGVVHLPHPDALRTLLPGGSAADANPDLGDSAILDTLALGGCAMAASATVVGLVRAGTFQDALNYTRGMDVINLGLTGGGRRAGKEHVPP